MKRQLTELASWLQAEGQHMENVIVKGASINSRNVKEGDLFIPFRGEHLNGHQFVRKAIEKGASASLWMKDEPNPPTDIPLIFVVDPAQALQKMAQVYREKLQCKVIGITGSNGKTSTKDLIYSVLKTRFNVKKTEGNFNNELGLPLTILSLDDDTEYAVLEMGMSNFGEISFLSKLAKPDYAVITNIGEAHMQDLGSRKGIAQAKFEIIDGLAKDGILFIDGDEVLLKELVEKNTEVETISFGYGADNQLALGEIVSTDKGSKFTVKGILDGEFTIPVYGAHQVKNALAAILLADEFAMSKEQIDLALQQAELTDMRMQPIIGKNNALYINDAYNAAPTSMRAALSFIKETKLREEKWVVLGDMLELGDDEKNYHELLAEQLTEMELKGIILYGQRMEWLYDKIKTKIKVPNLFWIKAGYQPIKKMLHQNTGEKSVVLVKGSRGLALEHVIELPSNGTAK